MKIKNIFYSLSGLLAMGLILRFSIGMQQVSMPDKENVNVGEIRTVIYANQAGDTLYKVMQLSYSKNGKRKYWDEKGAFTRKQNADSLSIKLSR